MLGPTHWNVAYVQPSRRPDDGRFGENPNRLFKHHQFQVILKPSPDEVQRPVSAVARSPAASTRASTTSASRKTTGNRRRSARWGIGWQVLFDGLEITQFTYFQQVGGIDLAPISVRDHLRARAHRDGAAARGQRLRPRVGARREVSRGAAPRRRSSSRSLRVRPGRRRRARPSSPRTIGICSTSITASAQKLLASNLIWPALERLPEVLAPVQHPRHAAAASASPSARPTSCASGSWRVAIAKAYVEGMQPVARSRLNDE